MDEMEWFPNWSIESSLSFVTIASCMDDVEMGKKKIEAKNVVIDSLARDGCISYGTMINKRYCHSAKSLAKIVAERQIKLIVCSEHKPHKDSLPQITSEFILNALHYPNIFFYFSIHSTG